VEVEIKIASQFPTERELVYNFANAYDAHHAEGLVNPKVRAQKKRN
jgi:hypothetical protein